MKRMRQNAKLRARNRHYRSTMRTEIKKVREAIASGDHAAASAQLPSAVAIIQRLAQKGIIHSRQANRRVSRLYKAISRAKAAA
jgi:small subunit ribosomal protein S20